MKQFYLTIITCASLLFAADAQTTAAYQWAKNISEGVFDETGRVIRMDASGNVYVSGSYRTSADLDPSSGTATVTTNGGYDAFLAKYDAAGNLVWGGSIGGSQYDYINDLALDALGNIYVTGYFYDTVDVDMNAGTSNIISAGASDVFLAKYDAGGNLVWARSMGGASVSAGMSLDVDPAGNVYLTGTFDGTIDLDPSTGTYNLTTSAGNDMFLAKYDALGNFVWAESFTGPTDELPLRLKLDAAMNIYIAGFFDNAIDFAPSVSGGDITAGTAGVRAMFIAKFDNMGNNRWAYSVGDADPVYLRDITMDAGANLYTTGYIQGTTDFDPSSGIGSHTPAGLHDMFIAKYDSAGNYVWSHDIGSASFDEGFGIASDGSNIYVTGGFQDTVDFDPSPATMELIQTAQITMFVAKYDGAGNLQWAIGTDVNSDPNYHYAVPQAIVANAAGDVVVTGEFENGIDFDPTASAAVLVSVDSRDAFIARYSEMTTAIKDITLQGAMLWPNPFTASVNIEGLKGGESIDIYNILGSKVHAYYNMQQGAAILNTSDLTPGVYFIQVSSGDHKLTRKIIKE